MLQRFNFLKRQRTALDYSHRYVIADHEVAKAQQEVQTEAEEPTAEERIAKVLEGFDPVNDPMDRLVLFEVTGARLYKDEFKDRNSTSSASSDDERDQGSNQQLLDIDYAMMGTY